MYGKPASILLFSGKRKCGKDFITDALINRIGSNVCTVVKVSAPIKEHWSVEKGVSFEELMSSGEMKEDHRKAMIEWSEAVRAKDPGYFCKSALEMYKADTKPIWVVSDARRKSDLKWFKEHYGDAVLTLRITANDNIRTQRGWSFTAVLGPLLQKHNHDDVTITDQPTKRPRLRVDDAETECNLDDYSAWDKIICNDGNIETETLVKSIISLIVNHNKTSSQLLSHLL